MAYTKYNSSSKKEKTTKRIKSWHCVLMFFPACPQRFRHGRMAGGSKSNKTVLEIRFLIGIIFFIILADKREISLNAIHIISYCTLMIWKCSVSKYVNNLTCF